MRERRAVRAIALLAVVGAVAVAAREWPAATERANALYSFVLPLGYAHILGAAAFDARRLGWPGRAPTWIAATFVVGAATSLLAFYALAIDALGAALLIPLIGISTWHTFENDLALARHTSSGLVLPPLSRADPHQLPSFALTTLFVFACASSEAGRSAAVDWMADTAPYAIETTRYICVAAVGWAGWRRVRWRWPGASLAIACALLDNRWVDISDLVAAATLYHALSWAMLVWLQLRSLQRDRPAEARRRRRILAAVHALPLLVFAAVSLPRPELETVRHTLTSPGLYLFWSVVHVVQTSLARQRGRG